MAKNLLLLLPLLSRGLQGAPRPKWMRQNKELLYESSSDSYGYNSDSYGYNNDDGDSNDGARSLMKRDLGNIIITYE